MKKGKDVPCIVNGCTGTMKCQGIYRDPYVPICSYIYICDTCGTIDY